ncbi:MAG: Gfo/Idh/MocA family protein [Faecalibacillus sp.]
MRFGIIGFGNIAKKFVKSIEYTDEGEIYAIASHSISHDDEYIRLHPEVKIYHDYDMLLKDEKIDAVYIAVPHYYHKEWIIKAIQHHKAVLSEKPLVLSVKDIDDIQKEVYQHQGYCLEAFKTKFNEGFHALKKDLIKIGDIKTIETNFCYDGRSLRRDSYLFDKKQGGALNDVGSYIVGFILGLVDSSIDHIESTIKEENGIEMEFFAKLYFQNGIVGIAEGAIDYNKERYALITGTQGKIYVPYYNRVIDYIIQKDNQTVERHYPIYGDDMTLEIQAVIDDVKNQKNENDIHSLEDSRYLQEIIEKIRKEAK